MTTTATRELRRRPSAATTIRERCGEPASRRRRWAPLTLAITAILALGGPGIAADIDGDGLDELGAFAIEVGGAARGPWLQMFNGTGQRVSNFFLGKELRDIRIRRIDYDADGRDEIVVLAMGAAGQPLLQVYNGDGARLASVEAAELGARRLELFPVEADGQPPMEIGVAYTRGPAAGTQEDPLAPWPTGLAQVWARAPLAPGGLTRGAFFEAIPAGFADHAWRVVDVEGDGRQELIAGFSLPPAVLLGETKSRGALARIWRLAGVALVDEITAAGEDFDGAQWLVGDLVESSSGEELMVGLRRRLDGVGVMRVFELPSPTGTPPAGGASPWLVARDTTPPAVSDLAWRAIRRDRPPQLPGEPPAADRHHALVGFRLADGAWAYRVWEAVVADDSQVDDAPTPSRGRSAGAMEPSVDSTPQPGDGAPVVAEVDAGASPSVGGGTILGAEVTVNDWLVGEFDGNPANGDGIVVLFTRGDRSIGFQHWSQAGLDQLGSGTLFGPTFIEPRGLAIRAVQPGRDDLAVIARAVSAAPRLELWEVNGPGTRLLTRNVLGPNVR